MVGFHWVCILVFLKFKFSKKINFIWRLDVYYTIKFTINRAINRAINCAIHNIIMSHDKSNDEKTNEEKTMVDFYWIY